MKERKRSLPSGWYPDNCNEIRSLLDEFTYGINPDKRLFSCIAPHAGWYYSGRIAAGVIMKVCGGRERVVVLGGHLPEGHGILAAFEDSFQTPLGPVKSASDMLVKLLEQGFKITEDGAVDNTIEVQLPIIAYASPEAEVLWLRVPPDEKAVKVVNAIYDLASSDGKSTVVVGSTDLTHYGPAYRFTPAGTGPEALEWVKNRNDADIIRALLAMNTEEVLRLASNEKSACSAGAAAGAAAYAARAGKKSGVLEQYYTSSDVMQSESFVGYAGITY